MTLLDELKTLFEAFDEAGIEYALCGGLAMAVHGVARATMDIDVLVLSPDVPRVVEAARKRGFTLPAAPMEFAGGAVRIRRVSKPGLADEEALPLDIIEVGDALRDVWESRGRVAWETGSLVVVGKAGLASLKRLRLSLQDRADLAALGEEAGDER